MSLLHSSNAFRSLLSRLSLVSAALSFFVALGGCATLKSNTFLGAAIGASAGAVGGTVIGAPYHAATGTLIGAASGAAVGALIGYLTEPKKSESKETSKSSSPITTITDDPSFTSPEVRRVWVPDKIDGNKFIKGHYMFVLERGSVWTMP